MQTTTRSVQRESTKNTKSPSQHRANGRQRCEHQHVVGNTKNAASAIRLGHQRGADACLSQE